MKVALTGGIACGKSLLARYLNELGVETLDADDVVHEIIPAEERRRLAPIIFNDPVARKALEEKIHPQVKKRIEDFFIARTHNPYPLSPTSYPLSPKIAIIPLLFEVQWDGEYDIIICVASDRAKQIERMMTTRGYSRDEAESRLAAQMDVAEKAKKSTYTIWNNSTPEDLKQEAVRLVEWLQKEAKKYERRT